MQRTYANQPSFAAGLLAPALHARVDLQKYAVGLKTCRNWLVHPQGGASNRPGFEFITEALDSSEPVRLIPFAFNTEQAYVLIFSDGKLRVIRNGLDVVQSDIAIETLASVTPPTLGATAHGLSDGDDVYLTGIENCPGGPYRVAAAGTDSFQLTDYAGNWIDATTWVLQPGAVINRIYTPASPFAQAALAELYYTQSADVMTFAHPDYAPRDLTRNGHASWAFSSVSFGASIAAPANLSATGGSGSVTYDYVVTAVHAETGEESVASVADTCTNGTLSAAAANTLAWDVVAGAAFYNVYKRRGGVYGFIGAADTNAYTDDGVIADMTTVPPTARTVFNATGEYPGVVAYHQQRRFFARPDNNTQNVKASRSGNYKNFNVSTPTQDDDALSFTLVAQQVNEIRHLISLDELIVLTAGGEWVVRGTNNGVLTPSSIFAKPQGQRGASTVRPLVVGETVLYLEPNGAVVRDLNYTLTSDKYTGTNLSVMAAHLFEGHAIVDWCYQQYPDSVVWAVRDDGVLLGFTYLREHEVWAWHEHRTDGAFESICCIPEGGEDAVYVSVKRTINGAVKRYVERMARRFVAATDSIADAFFVDSGLSYHGDPVDELFGLEWLEGKEVAILADGNVHPPRTVQNGYVQLQSHFSTIQIGLPIAGADLAPLPIDPEQLVGPKKQIPRVKIRVKDTRGIQVGASEAELEDTPQTVVRYDEPVEIVDGDIEVATASGWGEHGEVLIRQPHPLPATVLAIVPQVALGG